MTAGKTLMRGSCLPNLDKPPGGALPLPQAVIQFSDGYVMAAVNGGRTPELVQRLPGDISPGGRGDKPDASLWRLTAHGN